MCELLTIVHIHLFELISKIGEYFPNIYVWRVYKLMFLDLQRKTKFRNLTGV